MHLKWLYALLLQLDVNFDTRRYKNWEYFPTAHKKEIWSRFCVEPLCLWLHQSKFLRILNLLGKPRRIMHLVRGETNDAGYVANGYKVIAKLFRKVACVFSQEKSKWSLNKEELPCGNNTNLNCSYASCSSSFEKVKFVITNVSGAIVGKNTKMDLVILLLMVVVDLCWTNL